MNSGIYTITNKVTGDFYVGSAHNFSARWKLHNTNLRAGKHHSRRLQNSWDKHGVDAFAFTVVVVCAKADVLMYEDLCIRALQPQYNMAKSAQSRAGLRNTEKHNSSIAAKALERWADPEFKEAMRAKMKLSAKPLESAKHWREFTAFGKTQTLAAWSRDTGIGYGTLDYRMRKGWKIEDALTVPLSTMRGKGRKKLDDNHL
jgi:group I intron endonuclease